jgi:phosphoribosylaminoimidazolecarboxamide formyltransferase/IMP cyclohydrolase
VAKDRRALLSVYDKTGLVDLARGLSQAGVELISSGGTARALREAGFAVRDVSEITGVSEMMDGRVKTLHPKIHAGILGLRDNPEHVRQAREQGIEWIDWVVVNLYPFEATIRKPGATLADALENIDVGGPALLRAAAKNFQHVTVVCDPSQYGGVLRELRERGAIGEPTRRTLAAEAFSAASGYDRLIAGYLDARQSAERPLRYGENPHQAAHLSPDRQGGPNSLAGAVHHGEGKELSYNNYLDLDALLSLLLDLESPAAAIVKHGNPCGAAEAGTLDEAFDRALAGDPISAFGGVLGVNRALDRVVAERIARKENFFEVILAPGYGEGAVAALREGARWGKSLRILEVFMDRAAPRPKRARSIWGGSLVQENDAVLFAKFDSATVAPTDAQRRDLLFAWIVCKHARSNAIVLARDRMLVGPGAGQVSRVDAAKVAVMKAGDRARGSVAASDGFFPFADAVEVLLAAGVTAIVQPGGSRNDEAVVAVARGRGVPMILTGTRHFRH